MPSELDKAPAFVASPMQNLKSKIQNQSDGEIWREAIHCFNTRDWWMAHELLEQLWRRHPGTENARLYQGLLQAAVCLYHFGNGNFSGARQLAKGALELLAAVSTTHDLDVKKFRDTFDSATRELRQGEAVRPLHPREIPSL